MLGEWVVHSEEAPRPQRTDGTGPPATTVRPVSMYTHLSNRTKTAESSNDRPCINSFRMTNGTLWDGKIFWIYGHFCTLVASQGLLHIGDEQHTLGSYMSFPGQTDPQSYHQENGR